MTFPFVGAGLEQGVRVQPHLTNDEEQIATRRPCRPDGPARRADDVVTATLTLDGPTPPAPALVWDERHGWRTATSRRHPLNKGGVLPPEGDGIRYLATGTTPPPDTLIAALTV